MRRRVVLVSLAVVLAALGVAAYLVRGTCAALRDEIREVGWSAVRADPGLAYQEARLRASLVAAGWTVLPDRGLGDATLRQPLAVAVGYDDPGLGHLVLWVWDPPNEEGSTMILVLRRTEGPPMTDAILGKYYSREEAGKTWSWYPQDITLRKGAASRYIGGWLKSDWQVGATREPSGPCLPAASKLRRDYGRAVGFGSPRTPPRHPGLVLASLTILLAALAVVAYLVQGAWAALRDEIRELGWSVVRANPWRVYREARLRARLAAAGWTVLPDRGLGDARLREPLAVAVGYDDPALGHLVLWAWNPPNGKGSTMVLVIRRTEGPPTTGAFLGRYGFFQEAGEDPSWYPHDGTLGPVYQVGVPHEGSGPCFPAAAKLLADYGRACGFRSPRTPPKRRRVVLVSLTILLAALAVAAYLAHGTCAAIYYEIREVGWSAVRADPRLAYREAQLRASLTTAGWTVLPERGLGNRNLRDPLALAVDYDDPALGRLVLWVWKDPKGKGSIVVYLLRRRDVTPTTATILGEYAFPHEVDGAPSWYPHDGTPSKVCLEGVPTSGFGPCFAAAKKLRDDYLDGLGQYHLR
jgi:hypothetical protein